MVLSGNTFSSPLATFGISTHGMVLLQMIIYFGLHKIASQSRLSIQCSAFLWCAFHFGVPLFFATCRKLSFVSVTNSQVI